MWVVRLLLIAQEGRGINPTTGVSGGLFEGYLYPKFAAESGLIYLEGRHNLEGGLKVKERSYNNLPTTLTRCTRSTVNTGMYVNDVFLLSSMLVGWCPSVDKLQLVGAMC